MLYINPSSNIPIYQQIVDQIKEGVLKGVLASGDKLPSVREMAVMITINPNTIQKAYQELERQKIIETVRGRGTFITKGIKSIPNKEKLQDLQEYFKKGLIDAHYLGLSTEEINHMLKKILRELDNFGEGK